MANWSRDRKRPTSTTWPITIDATTGHYTAGTTGSVVDRIKVTDGVGNSAAIDIAIGPNLQIQPSTVYVPSGALRTFSASGGSGTGIVFQLATNASGGSITPGGEYRAGPTGPRTDVVVAGRRVLADGELTGLTPGRSLRPSTAPTTVTAPAPAPAPASAHRKGGRA